MESVTYENGDADAFWNVILEIWRLTDPSNVNRIGVLAAGPIEDLIEYHGPKVIDRIEALARQDPEFRKMLRGV